MIPLDVELLHRQSGFSHLPFTGFSPPMNMDERKEDHVLKENQALYNRLFNFVRQLSDAEVLIQTNQLSGNPLPPLIPWLKVGSAMLPSVHGQKSASLPLYSVIAPSSCCSLCTSWCPGC